MTGGIPMQSNATPDIQVKPMTAFDRDVRREAAAVFVDAFHKELSFLSPDREAIIAAFAEMFCPDVFHVAELYGEIAGILACSNREKQAIAYDPRILRRHFGWKGRVSHLFMKNEFNKAARCPADTGYIECVATATNARRRGVSTALLRHVMEHAPYKRFVLDVTDVNTGAYALYKKLGFSEVEREPESFSRIKGFKERIYMEWRKAPTKNRA